jgi:hypothetical protein
MLLLEIQSLTSAAQLNDPISFMSDNTLFLGMEVGPAQELVRTIRVIKSRGSAHDGSRHILFIGRGGVIVE